MIWTFFRYLTFTRWPNDMLIETSNSNCMSLPEWRNLLWRRMKASLWKKKRGLWKTWSRCLRRKKWSFWRKSHQSCLSLFRTSRQRLETNRKDTTSDLKSLWIFKWCAIDVTYSCFFVQLNELKNELQPLMQMVKEGKIPAGKVSTLGYIFLMVLLSATTSRRFLW